MIAHSARGGDVYDETPVGTDTLTDNGQAHEWWGWGTFGDQPLRVNFFAMGCANPATNGTGATLTEGAGAINQVTPTKVTVEASLSRYGYMIEYTDEAVLFSEDSVQVKYREELGYLMNQTNEDLLQKDMLSSAGIVINAGGDITQAQIGTGVAADGSTDATYKVSFDLVRKGVKALVRNRAQRPPGPILHLWLGPYPEPGRPGAGHRRPTPDLLRSSGRSCRRALRAPRFGHPAHP